MRRSPPAWRYECTLCGNPRELLPPGCTHCGDMTPPLAHCAYQRVDLEAGAPSVEEALARLDEHVRAAHEVGLKWLLVVHGYGSSGAGGRIRRALRARLDANEWADRIKEVIACEEIRVPADLRARIGARIASVFECMERERLLANAGATILILYPPGRGPLGA